MVRGRWGGGVGVVRGGCGWDAVLTQPPTKTLTPTELYELYHDCTLMFFYRNKHIMIGAWVVVVVASCRLRAGCGEGFTNAHPPPLPPPDLGTGDNNKITWAISKQDLIDVIETVYRGARKGRGLVIAPKDHSTKHKY